MYRVSDAPIEFVVLTEPRKPHTLLQVCQNPPFHLSLELCPGAGEEDRAESSHHYLYSLPYALPRSSGQLQQCDRLPSELVEQQDSRLQMLR